MTIKDVTRFLGLSYEDLLYDTGLPESTLSDILSGKTDLRRCRALTMNKLSNALGLTPDAIMSLEPVTHTLPDASLHPVHEYFNARAYRDFRKDALEELALCRNEDFIREVLDEKIVEDEYLNRNYAQALFLIGLVDYLTDKQELLRDTRYNRYRGDTMKSMIYPFGDKDAFLNGALLMPEAIPQLLKFNILETPKTLEIL